MLRCHLCIFTWNCRGFKQDCPTGELYKEKIIEMYSLILPSGNAQVFYDLCNVGDDATHFLPSLRNRCSSIRFSEYLTKMGTEASTSRWALDWEIDVIVKKMEILSSSGFEMISLKEFMLATDMTASGSPEEKLRWAFKMYDKVDQRTWWWGWW